jgi:hypothetical protein
VQRRPTCDRKQSAYGTREVQRSFEEAVQELPTERKRHGNTAYGDISPRTAAYAAKELLKRGLPYLVIEKFGQAKTLPANNSKTIKFRRYNALPNTPVALTEGVTPGVHQQLTYTDITATLSQYGDRVTVTDVIEDTHEDPVLQEAIEILGEQAAQMIEKMRFGVLKAGTERDVRQRRDPQRGEHRDHAADPAPRRAYPEAPERAPDHLGRALHAGVRHRRRRPGLRRPGAPGLRPDVRSLTGFVPAERTAP